MDKSVTKVACRYGSVLSGLSGTTFTTYTYPQKNGKTRPLGIPTVHDRAMQALFLLAAEPVAESSVDHHSYGFRPKRSAADAIERCFVVLAQRSSAQWILEGDIKGCFDNIRHDWMLRHPHIERKILAQWLKAGFVEKGQLLNAAGWHYLPLSG